MPIDLSPGATHPQSAGANDDIRLLASQGELIAFPGPPDDGTDPAGQGDQASELGDLDEAQKLIVAPQNRLVVGVSTRGTVLTNAVDEVLEKVLKEAVEAIPGLRGKGWKSRDEVVESTIAKVQNKPFYKELRDRLLEGAKTFDDAVAQLFLETSAGEAKPGATEKPPFNAAAFDPLDLIGFEMWVPPFNPDALSGFADGEGNLAGDIGNYLRTSFSNGFMNVKVFTDGLDRIPWVKSKGGANEFVTILLNLGAQAFGAQLAGVEAGDIVENFVAGGGTLFSGPDVAKGNNFQVGMPLGSFGTDGFFVPTDEIWLTSLTYNVPITGNETENKLAQLFYLGYSDLRRTILTRNAQGEWGFTGFQIADRAIELGFKFLPGDETTGAVNVHVGTIGRFSAYFDKEAIVDGSVRQLPDGTLGYYFEDDGVDYFRPFDEQDAAIFTNVFLARQDGVSLDDVRVLGLAEEFETVTDADLEGADQLGPVARWVVENGNRPEVQDAWSAGVTLIPALLTGDPIAIGFAGANAFVDVNQSQFNRSYDDIVANYTVKGSDGADEFSASAFVNTEFLGIAKDLERVEDLYAEYVEATGFDLTLAEFVNDDRLSAVGKDVITDVRLAEIVSEKTGIVEYMEHRVEGLQGVTNRLLTEGHASATELYGALARYVDTAGANAVPSPDGMEGLFSSLAERLLGTSDPIVLFSGEGRNASTDWSENIAANFASIGVETGRPPVLRLLYETDGLTDLSEFGIDSLGEIDDATSFAEVAGILIEDRDVDPFQIYATLEASKPDAYVRSVVRDSPALSIPSSVDAALEGSLKDTLGPYYRGDDPRIVGESGLAESTLQEKIDFLAEVSGLDLTASVADLPLILDTYKKVLTGVIEVPARVLVPPLGSVRSGPIGSVVEGEYHYDLLIEDLALELLEQGLSDGTGVPDLDATIARFAGIRDGTTPVDRIAAEYGVSEETAERIGAAREIEPVEGTNYLMRDHVFLRSRDGIANPQASVTLGAGGTFVVAGGLGAPGQDGLIPDLPDAIPRDETIIAGPFPPEQEIVLTPAQRTFGDAVNALPEGPERDARIRALYDEYLLTPDAEGLTSLDAFRDARYGEATAEQVDEATYVTIFDASATANAEKLVAAQRDPGSEAGQAARADLEAQGLVFDENGYLDRSQGSGAMQIAGLAAEAATNPEFAAFVQANPGADAARIAALLAGESPEAAPPDLAELRGETRALIGDLSGLGGNEGAIAFLETFDLVLASVELAGGDFGGAEIAAFLQAGGAAGGIGYFLERLGAGDGAAWAALSNDLGVFGASLTDVERETFKESAYGLSLTGSVLRMAGSQAGDEALTVSGELVAIASDTMLAAAGEAVPGFTALDTPPPAAGGAERAGRPLEPLRRRHHDRSGRHRSRGAGDGAADLRRVHLAGRRRARPRRGRRAGPERGGQSGREGHDPRRSHGRRAVDRPRRDDLRVGRGRRGGPDRGRPRPSRIQGRAAGGGGDQPGAGGDRRGDGGPGRDRRRGAA